MHTLPSAFRTRSLVPSPLDPASGTRGQDLRLYPLLLDVARPLVDRQSTSLIRLHVHAKRPSGDGGVCRFVSSTSTVTPTQRQTHPPIRSVVRGRGDARSHAREQLHAPLVTGRGPPTRGGTPNRRNPHRWIYRRGRQRCETRYPRRESRVATDVDRPCVAEDSRLEAVTSSTLRRGGVCGPETTLPTVSCGSSCEGHPFPFRFVPGSSSTRNASLKGKAPEEKGTNPRYEGSWFWRVFHARLRRPSRRRRRLRSVPAFVRRGCAPWKEATVPPKPSCCRLRACRGACETPSSGVRRMPPPETAERKGSYSSPLGASRASAFVSNEISTECIRTCVRERQRRAKVDPPRTRQGWRLRPAKWTRKQPGTSHKRCDRGILTDRRETTDGMNRMQTKGEPGNAGDADHRLP